MSPENFVYWLNGFAELTDRNVDALQWKIIKEHLALVLTKKTPTTYESWRPVRLDELFREKLTDNKLLDAIESMKPEEVDVDTKLKEDFSNVNLSRNVLDLIAKEPIPNYLETHGIEKLREIRC